MTAPIELIDLHKEIRVGFRARRVPILKGLSLSVPKGSVFGFIGPNGAGKSTTIKIAIGAAEPSSGQVRLFGAPPRSATVRQRLGYLPEFPRLPEQLTPRELLTLHATLAGVQRAQIAARCDALLERVSLSDRGDSRVGTFSKGMQQRVGLALALVGEPELLILDEPMSGLDPVGRRLVRDIITEQRALGRTVFFSSHVLPDVEALCDEVALVVDGRVVEHADIAQIGAEQVRGHELLFRGPTPAEALAKQLGEVEKRGQTYVLRLDAAVEPIGAAAKLRDAGAVIERVEPLKPSLEEHLVALIDAQSQTNAAPRQEAS